jgi:hypothetical protein
MGKHIQTLLNSVVLTLWPSAKPVGCSRSGEVVALIVIGNLGDITSLLTNHSRASCLSGALPGFLTFSPGASHLAFGISPSSSKAFVTGKDLLSSGKAPSPNCASGSGLQAPSEASILADLRYRPPLELRGTWTR